MLFHLSIDADDPRHVAHVLAEYWGGVAMPFPPVIEGSWVAFAGDDRGTIVEVYPRGTEVHESAGDADAQLELLQFALGIAQLRGADHMVCSFAGRR